jgi:alpha-galactosidase
VDVTSDGSSRVTLTWEDPRAEVAGTSALVLHPSGVVELSHRLRNTGETPLTVDALTCSLPIGDQAREVLDFTGRWALEKAPQRGPLRDGLTLRESRRGRTGHDATGLLIAGTPGFGFRSGEVWAVHTGWSGGHVHALERRPAAATLLGGGELLDPGEVVLGAGEAYATPSVFFAWSDQGLDGMAARLHGYLRDRPSHPSTPRPVTLNVWEAVYFDHDHHTLNDLAERAQYVGVERYVLDDGWFRGRRDATAGLGDWTADPEVWPEGLNPLADRVRELGMEFGLWVEPEMVNPDSDLLRAHPDWLLAADQRVPPPRRHQQVLDVAEPAVRGYLMERLTALVEEYGVAAIKWDHNRDLLEAVHAGAAGVHAQTLAVYGMLDELRERHPGLEIESCASGGGRIDYGVLARTDRVWTSDTNDPVDRQAIQRWTGLLLPPELMGSHVGAERTHVTGRVSDLGLRLATALFAHAGIEWDLTGCDDAELEALAAWIGAYKRLRGLLHSGTVVHADHPDDQVWLHGVVAQDRRRAVFAVVRFGSDARAVPAPLRIPGLDPRLAYRIESCDGIPLPPDLRRPTVPWLEAGGVTLSGAVLDHVGLAAPVLNPGRALVIELAAQADAVQ